MSLEKKKLNLELMRVKMARMELEFRVDERKEEIKKLEDNIKISEAKEQELSDKMKTLEG
jgi:hypothetical protein